jgi:hypothetical protein
MNLIKLIVIITVYFSVINLLKAQDSAKTFYFPHKTGDMWEYFYDDYSPLYIDTLQNITLFNAVNSKGFVHIKQFARFINPAQRAVVLSSDTTNYWIDTTNNYVYGPSFLRDSVLIYKLEAKKGEQWVVFEQTSGAHWYFMARVKSKWNGSLFGKKTTFINIAYYTAANVSDTTGYSVIGGDLIADGFGLIGRGGGESPGEINLIGALINGKKYGNLTKISFLKDPIPSEIILYQNYPNPFNPSTTISFSLSRRSNVSLVIYNILGKEVTRLIDYEEYAAGLYKITWNGTNDSGQKTATGIYFYRLVTDNKTISKSMIFLK